MKIKNVSKYANDFEKLMGVGKRKEEEREKSFL